MRLLVLSDSHGNSSAVQAALEAQPTATNILFLGDGMCDIDSMESLYPDRNFYKVSGNCDFASLEPLTRLVELGGVRIMMTHGHEYRVKFGTGEAMYTARRNGCQLLLYGHTHRPETTYEDGLTTMNPGSVSRSGSYTYGVVDLTEKGIFCNVISL